MSARHRLACALACALITLGGAAPASAQLFRRFVACDSCITDFYYVDQSSGFFPQDWNCSDSTYDGHLGTDFSLINGNASIDDGYEITAASAGTVISTEDGYFDHCTQCGGAQCGYDFGNGFANQVYIDHGGYYAMYGHMRTGSVMVQPGDTVTCGQVIGHIGSAGCSTGAHVHFEPQSPSTQLYVDPYEGDCSPTASSLWVGQGGHRTLPSTSCDDGTPPAPTCPAETYPIWTCNEDMSARRRCVSGVDTTEPCAGGCTVMPTGTDDVCALPPDADADGSRADVDCDETSNAIHPGAIDGCGDAIDQDCSGADAICVPSGGAGGAASGGVGAAAGALAMAGAGAGGIAGGAAGFQSAGAPGAPNGGVSGASGVAGVSGGLAGMTGSGGFIGAPPVTPGARTSTPSGCRSSGAPRADGARSLLAFGIACSALALRRRRCARG